MKILFAIKAMDDAKGGAERVLSMISGEFVRRGHDVSLLTFDPPDGQSFYPLAPEIKRISLGIGDTKRNAKWGETLSRIRAMRKTIKSEKPDVVIAFMHSMFVPMAFALIGTGIPVIASEHIVPAHYKGRPLQYVLLLASSFFVQKITVLSEKIKQDYPAFMHKKMVAITNPVCVPDIPVERGAENKKRKIILTVGRLDPQKDQKTLIEAFAGIASECPDWDLRIVGDGDLRPALEKQIVDLGLENRITLVGSVQNISEEYQNADIFALPSKYESFGLATAEAMAHGLPVIGFADCPGTNELIVDGENGLLIEGEDRVDVLVDALKTMIEAPDMIFKLGKKGKQNVQTCHLEEVTQKWEDTIKQHIV